MAKIGKADRDRLAVEAAARGGAERQRAEEGLARARSETQQVVAQGARDVSQGFERYRAEEDRQRVRGMQEQAQDFGQEMDIQKLQMAATERGLEHDPAALQRLRDLQNEMDRGERQARQQGREPLEMAGEGPGGAFKPGAGYKAEQARKDIQAKAQERHGAAAILNAINSSRKLDMAERTGDTKTAAEMRRELGKEAKNLTKLWSRMQLEEGTKELTQGEWYSILQEAMETPGVDAGLIQDLQHNVDNPKNPVVTPRIRTRMETAIGKATVSSIQFTKGDISDVENVSWDNPVMQKFVDWTKDVRDFFANDPLIKALPIKNLAKRNKLVNFLAAIFTNAGLSPMPKDMAGGGGANPLIGATQTQPYVPPEGSTPPQPGAPAIAPESPEAPGSGAPLNQFNAPAQWRNVR